MHTSNSIAAAHRQAAVVDLVDDLSWLVTARLREHQTPRWLEAGSSGDLRSAHFAALRQLMLEDLRSAARRLPDLRREARGAVGAQLGDAAEEAARMARRLREHSALERLLQAEERAARAGHR